MTTTLTVYGVDNPYYTLSPLLFSAQFAPFIITCCLFYPLSASPFLLAKQQQQHSIPRLMFLLIDFGFSWRNATV